MQNQSTPTGTITVEKPGPMALVQDLGRRGCQQAGLTTSGAADQKAYYWANHLLGNTQATPVFEISFGPALLHFTANTRVAITGTQCKAMINGRQLYPWSSGRMPAGGRLHISMPTQGLRTYIAIEGGFLAPRLFDSCARVPREALPHPFGNAIAAGEHFTYRALSQHRWQALNCMTPFYQVPDHEQPLTLSLRPCYQYGQFSETARTQLQSRHYKVSAASDRMGYRLKGPRLDYPGHLPFSEGIALGSVQVPPDGQPIILLRDRQTIGGYPKIGTITEEDCDALSQRRPGQTVSFTIQA